MTDNQQTRRTVPRLSVITGTVRPGRIGPTFARWFADVAERHGAFAVERVDLAEVALPFHDEPHHPKTGQYIHTHTQRWSEQVSRADAFVLVSPEYNYGYSPVLKNALDYLHAESGRQSGRLRELRRSGCGHSRHPAAQAGRMTLRMVPVFESVSVAFASTHLQADGALRHDSEREAAATAMLDELARLTRRLRP